jgi:hypothetical protein
MIAPKHVRTSFTLMGKEADLIVVAGVRPLTSRLTHPAHPPTLAPDMGRRI